MSIKTSERLTRDEMVEKYPDQWLFIVEPEINNNTSELISGIVTAHSDLRDDLYSELKFGRYCKIMLPCQKARAYQVETRCEYSASLFFLWTWQKITLSPFAIGDKPLASLG